MIGQVYGRWLVLKDLGTKTSKHKMAECQCECGFISSVRQYRLKNGESTQCKGCAAKSLTILVPLSVVQEAVSTGSVRGVAKSHGFGRGSLNKAILSAGYEIPSPNARSSPDVVRKKIADCRANKTEFGCWLWTGSKARHGYGSLKLNGKNESAHRASYILNKGEIPKGSVVMHSCNNTSCVNPDHLSVGTQTENMAYAISLGRAPQLKKLGG